MSTHHPLTIIITTIKLIILTCFFYLRVEKNALFDEDKKKTAAGTGAANKYMVPIARTLMMFFYQFPLAAVRRRI